MIIMDEYRLKIEKSFNSLLSLIEKREKDEKDKILTNIYKVGPSFEHWLQLELFSQLSNEFSGESWDVQPEKGRHRFDIGISSQGKLVIAIELKVIANWSFTRQQQDGILSDIYKLNNINVPDLYKYVILFTQFGEPSNQEVAWMQKQLANKSSVIKESEFKSNTNRIFKECTDEIIYPLREIETCNFYFNKLLLGGVLVAVK